jgi:hypothetical protein
VCACVCKLVCDLLSWSRVVTGFPQPAQQFKAIHPVHHGNTVKHTLADTSTSTLNHPPHVKRRLIQSLHNRASTICQEWQIVVKEISILRSDLQVNGYPQGFINSVIYSKGSSHLNKEQKPLGSLYNPEPFSRSMALWCHRLQADSYILPLPFFPMWLNISWRGMASRYLPPPFSPVPWKEDV